MRRVVYPGTFDPVTVGHEDIVRRCLNVFDEVVVAVAEDTSKVTLFSLQERVRLMQESFKGESSIIVKPFSGLLVEFLEQEKVYTIVRGMRVLSDFEYEFQMALTNKHLRQAVETIFMVPQEQFVYISSRLIKEIWTLKGDISSFVSPHVLEAFLSVKGRV